MTKPQVHRCAWCGERMARSTGPGRPRRFCRPSHRQRHYESRREAELRKLSAGEMVFTVHDVGRLRDAIYVLEAAIQDARMDLADSGALEAYPQAFRDVTAAAEDLVRTPFEPKAASG